MHTHLVFHPRLAKEKKVEYGHFKRETLILRWRETLRPQILTYPLPGVIPRLWGHILVRVPPFAPAALCKTKGQANEILQVVDICPLPVQYQQKPESSEERAMKRRVPHMHIAADRCPFPNVGEI